MKLLAKVNNQVLAVGAAVTGTLLSSVSAYADSDISNVTDSVSSALSSSKSEFAAAIGSVVAVGIGFFLLKFVVLQVINYFKKVAK